MPIIRTTNGTEMNVSQEAWDSVYSKRPDKYSLASGETKTTTSSPVTSTSQINALYQRYFGRNASSAEIANWSKEPATSLDSFLQREQVKYNVAPTPTPTPATPTAPTVDMTGWSEANKQTFQVLADKVDSLIASGQRVNPNITIDDATIQRFAEQAKTELAPYYRELFAQSDADLKNSMEQVKQSYNRSISDIGRTYGEALENTQESFGQRGLQFSSDRTKSEQDIATKAERAVQDAATQAEQQARQYGTTGERTLGSSAFPTIDTSVTTGQTLQLGKAGQYGLTGGSSRSLFNPTGGVTGSLERNQLFDTEARKTELTNAEREYRAANTQ